MSEHIKVVYYDDDPIVYRDDKILTEKEIVNLLVEFFKDCDTLINENQELKERNNRQKDTITKQQEQIDNYIDIKAKLNAKIKEYETKSEEYELGACICGARKYAFKMQALAEFKEGIYENKNNNEFQS